MTYQDRLLRVIPGGAHTYSKGYDQFPSNAPQILKRAKGAYVYTPNGNEFLDYGMGLRSVILGYANERVNKAACQQIEYGNNLTRPSIIELEAAEQMVDLIDSFEMVKFAKNGSSATTAAIKLARAYTGKEMVAICKDHPFFSYDDWFIASTSMNRGVRECDKKGFVFFNYNDLDSLKAAFAKYPNKIAAVIMEPATIEHPKNNFLQNVKDLCEKEGAVFILDEMITGFRWHLKGAQYYYGVKPHLSTFGKAMANGFSVACVGGEKEIMQLGSIEQEGQERLFLLSTTHGAEMSGLGAFLETIKVLRELNVIEYIWSYGKKLIELINHIADEFGIASSFYADGIECSPYYIALDQDGQLDLAFRTLFQQEMIKKGVLMPWIALSYAHQQKEFELTHEAIYSSLEIYKKALENGIQNYLQCKAIKPVFRKYN